MKNHLGRWLSAVVVSLVGCSSGSHGSFDAQNAPFGTRTPTTVSHSTVQLGSSSVNGVTQVVGSKTIGGTTYSRLSYTNASDPSSGVEWWINEKPGESVTLAGWDGHSQLAQSLSIPPGVVVLTGEQIAGDVESADSVVPVAGVDTDCWEGAGRSLAAVGDVVADDLDVWRVGFQPRRHRRKRTRFAWLNPKYHRMEAIRGQSAQMNPNWDD